MEDGVCRSLGVEHLLIRLAGWAVWSQRLSQQRRWLSVFQTWHLDHLLLLLVALVGQS